VGSVVILQYSHSWAFKVVKLPPVHRAEKNPQRRKDTDYGQGNQQVQGFH
jgi:hypothetical protein